MTASSGWDHVILTYVQECNQAQTRLHAACAGAFADYNQAVNVAVRRRNAALAGLRTGPVPNEGAAK